MRIEELQELFTKTPAGAVSVSSSFSGVAASDVSFTSGGGLSSTTVQAAIAELESEKATGDTNTRVAVRKNSGANVGTRRRINLIEGSNVTLTVADDAVNEEVDVTIAASGGAADFLALTDTPNAYTAQAGKFVKVNAGETALEFAALAGGGDMLAANNLSDVANATTARTNLSAAKSGANTDITSVSLSNTGLALMDKGGDHVLSIGPSENLTANRTLEISVGDTNRTLTIGASSSVSGTNTGDQDLSSYQTLAQVRNAMEYA